MRGPNFSTHWGKYPGTRWLDQTCAIPKAPQVSLMPTLVRFWEEGKSRTVCSPGQTPRAQASRGGDTQCTEPGAGCTPTPSVPQQHLLWHRAHEGSPECTCQLTPVSREVKGREETEGQVRRRPVLTSRDRQNRKALFSAGCYFELKGGL